MKVSFVHSGSFDNMKKYLTRVQKFDPAKILEPYAKEGVNALSANTPSHTGLAANSWGYEIRKDSESVSIVWTNSNVENGFPVVIMLQYGYATGTGGYVQGRDYINPALRPIFDDISKKVWKEVTSA